MLILIQIAFCGGYILCKSKTKEDDNIVEFELVSLLELQEHVPARTIYQLLWMAIQK